MMLTHWKPELGEDDPKRYITGNDDIIQMLVEKIPSIHFEPGEKWQYSNTGYVLLATIVERVSGKPFEEFMEERVFGPAGMTDTSVYNYMSGQDKSMSMRVFGYSQENGMRISNDVHFLNFAKGDGGIYSTLEDLLKWDRVLYTEQLVTNPTLEKVFKQGRLNNGETFEYGFGWFVEDDKSGRKIVYHGGGWVGFGTYIYRDLASNSSFIVLTNNSSWNEVEALVTEFKRIMSESKI
jgi:CubicO group peptidase (beta-lactamase class C family)